MESQNYNYHFRVYKNSDFIIASARICVNLSYSGHEFVFSQKLIVILLKSLHATTNSSFFILYYEMERYICIYQLHDQLHNAQIETVG